MSKWVHRLTEKNEEAGTAVCAHCGPTLLVSNGKQTCCYYKRVASNNKSWVVHKKTYCERCGFVAEHPSQLDVDHIDGNKSNSDISNLMTLCANCHRLKTHTARDSVPRQPNYGGRN